MTCVPHSCELETEFISVSGEHLRICQQPSGKPLLKYEMRKGERTQPGSKGQRKVVEPNFQREMGPLQCRAGQARPLPSREAGKADRGSETARFAQSFSA